MKKLTNRILRLVIAIVCIAFLGALAFVYSHYWFVVLAMCGLVYFTYKLYCLNIKTVKHFTLFVDSIKFSDNSLALSNSINHDEYEAYYSILSKSLKNINRLTQKREADINFYDKLLNKVDFGLVVVEKDGKVKWINNFALNILNIPSVNSLNDLPAIFRNTFESLAPRTPKILKIESPTKCRSLVVNLSKLEIRGEQMEVFSFKDMQPVVDEIESVAWEQLVGVLTHEIMNSLTPIISLAETFSTEDNEPQMITKAMQTINRRSSSLIQFVSNYKKLAQMPDPLRAPISVKDLMDDVNSLMVAQGIEIKMLITSNNLSIYGDRGQLEQVLINLIKNGWEACAHKAKPCVKLTATENIHQQLVISVSDNGEGIEAEMQEKIFTPFYSTKQSGSGIGLSISRQIVNKHNGKLTVTSELNKGSVFSIVL